jgi:acyl-CoA synthetase (AMP-forming)/AMP-acid ligase II
MTTSDVATDLPCAWQPSPVDAESVALLQYTSCSTTAPKRVVLTHRKLTSNSELLFRFFGHSEESRGVSWLPPYYDMSLIDGVIQPFYGEFPVMLMTPADFIRRPLSWLQEISRIRATTSGGPDFAHELCVRKTAAAQRDLSSWRDESNGSGPIRAETMENFTLAFESARFSHEAFHPCYGLAEATLIVTGGLPWSRRSVKAFDAVGSRSGTAVSSAVGTSSRRLMSCGFAARDRDVAIVDPDTRVERTAGQVGEIWTSGRDVAFDVAHAASVADLAIRLDEQITAKAAAAGTELPAATSLPELTVADKAPARLYRWIRGSRVLTDAAADAGSFLDPAARRPGERPGWAW